jgi:hypothetical protein
MLQDIAVKCVRHLNIVGECNIQYAFNAETNDYRTISTTLGRDCSWMSISGEHWMISLPAHYAWFWLPKSLRKKTIYANMTNISDSSVRKTAKISQKPRINNAKYHV